MTELKSANIIDRQRVEDLSARGPEPVWLADSRLTAWEAYLQTPMPTTRDEEWRHTDISALDLSALHTVDCGPLLDNEKSVPNWYKESLAKIGKTSGLMVQQTQSPGYRQLSAELEKQGVIFCDLHTALERHPDLVRQYLTAQGGSEGKFGLMNRALFNCGLLLYVPANLEIAAPFINVIGLTTGGAIFPRILVIAGDNSKFNLIQVFDSQHGDSAVASLAVGLTQVYVGSGAGVSFLELNNFGPNSYAINRTHNEVSQDGSFNSLAVALGGKQTKHDIATLLQASGAHSEVLGVVLGSGKEQYDFNTIQEHNATDTTSDINFRVALKDAASSTYQGIIRVDKVAQRTNAYQSNKNLLLGQEARADSIPKLEILADDVKCSHGATVGPVDKEQLFYLMSRGFPLAQAEQLIVLGFFRQVLERINLPAVTDWLTEIVARKLYDEAAL